MRFCDIKFFDPHDLSLSTSSRYQSSERYSTSSYSKFDVEKRPETENSPEVDGLRSRAALIQLVVRSFASLTKGASKMLRATSHASMVTPRRHASRGGRPGGLPLRGSSVRGLITTLGNDARLKFLRNLGCCRFDNLSYWPSRSMLRHFRRRIEI